MKTAIDTAQIIPALAGVPETMLWTIWTRSAYAQGPDSLLHDPLLIDLMERIDYPFPEHFGRPSAIHAIRSRYADERIRDFLKRSRGAAVVVLGEGLETQFWRVDNETVQWYSVDLPESIAIRRELLPSHPRNHLLECSALDSTWMDRIEVEAEQPVFISAAGLLMYFSEVQVVEMLQDITRRFPGGGEIFFDTIPPWFSRKTLRGWRMSPHYTAPQMPFGLALGDLPALIARVPQLHLLTALNYSQPYPAHMRSFNLLSRIPLIHRRLAPGLIHCRFGE